MAFSDPKLPWYRQPVMWLVVGVPASAVLFGAVMITLALTTNDGLVADDYYKRGLEINRSLERDRIATQLGLQAEIHLDHVHHKVMVDLRWPVAAPFPSRPELSFSHATRKENDKIVALDGDGRGQYWGTLPDLAKGRWYVQLATAQWRLQTVVQLPQPGTLHLDASSTN